MHISNLTAALALAVTLASCSSPAPTNTDNSPHTRDVFAMDTYMSMKAYGENGEKALSEAEEYIKKLESDLSATSPDSCISRVNSADSKPTEVTDEAAEIIAKALEIGKKTNGALDITLYPMLKEWGFTTGEYQIPKTEDISRILRNTGFEKCSDVISRDSYDYIKLTAHTFDIIILDPPYRHSHVHNILPFAAKKINDGGCIICEYEADSEEPSAPEGMILRKTYHYGKINVTIFIKPDPEEVAEE